MMPELIASSVANGSTLRPSAKRAPMVLPTPPWSLARVMPRSRQKASSAPAKSWFGRSRSAKARLVVAAPAAATAPARTA